MMSHALTMGDKLVACGKLAWRCNWTTNRPGETFGVTCKQCVVALARATASVGGA